MSDAHKLDGSPWKNRIIGHDNVPPDSLLANPHNYRIHPKNQQSALAGSLSELGWLQTVIVNQTTGQMLDGHLRVELALRNNEPTVPVTIVELSEAEEKLALATFDPITAMAAHDRDILESLLQDVQTADADLQQMLADLAAEAGLLFGDNGQGEADAEPQIDRAEELRQQWGTELGQLWRLPSRTAGQEHRLICGDCTDAAVVERVMGGEKAESVVTDSPYGINREGIENDDPEGLRKLFDGCLFVLPVKDAVIINFQSPRLFPVWLDAIRAASHKFERALWFYDKTDVTYPWRGWLMTSQMALVSTVGKPKWANGVNHHDCYIVETAGQQDDSGGHTTAKPLDVIKDLAAHTVGTVYDPFLGSGTTLIAAENLSRQCRVIEIAPGYVAVALQRYKDAFGIEPELVK